MHFPLVGDHPQMKENAFLHSGKKPCPHLVRFHPMGSFIFSSLVNELGSLIHTLSKSTQMLLASSEAPVEAIGKIIFSEIADWHGINTHDLGLFSTMHYWTKILNKNIAIETPKALYNETLWESDINAWGREVLRQRTFTRH